MNDDPFSPMFLIEAEEKQSSTYSSDLIGFFICSFDTTYGLQILYSYPSNLRKKAEEVNILKTHYIWKIKFIPTNIDLAFSDFVYSAFQLHKSKEDIVQATADNPLYGVVIKLRKRKEPVVSDKFIEIRNDLQDNHWREINLLYKYQILSLKPTRRSDYRELSPEISKIQQYMKSLWKEFQNKVTNAQKSRTIQIKDQLGMSIVPTKQDIDLPDLFKDKIKMRLVEPVDLSTEVLVILTNIKESLEDVTIQVSSVSDFFSETLWEQFLDEWPVKEEVILEFPQTSIVEKYQIKIIGSGRTIMIKTIEIDFIEH